MIIIIIAQCSKFSTVNHIFPGSFVFSEVSPEALKNVRGKTEVDFISRWAANDVKIKRKKKLPDLASSASCLYVCLTWQPRGVGFFFSFSFSEGNFEVEQNDIMDIKCLNLLYAKCVILTVLMFISMSYFIMLNVWHGNIHCIISQIMYVRAT